MLLDWTPHALQARPRAVNAHGTAAAGEGPGILGPMLTVTRRLVATVLAATVALPAAAADSKDSGPTQSLAPPVPAAALDAPTRAPEPFIRGHRYAYVAGGVLLLGGVGFGFVSRGESSRADSLQSARQSSAALRRARTAAATANVMYGVAGLTLAYGLLLELLPEPAADAASLTYHF